MSLQFRSVIRVVNTYSQVGASGPCWAGPAAAADIPVNCGDTLSVPGGQYVLTGNLACPASPAVHITGNNVHFDLKGFTLSKTGSATGTGIITAAGNTCVATSWVHIHNGTVTNLERLSKCACPRRRALS
jgi:hypothetical protein